MKLPIQAQPIIRTLDKMFVANMIPHVSTSGIICGMGKNCGHGYWCCGKSDGTGVGTCVPCKNTGLFGECHDSAKYTCGNIGMVWLP